MCLSDQKSRLAACKVTKHSSKNKIIDDVLINIDVVLINIDVVLINIDVV